MKPIDTTEIARLATTYSRGGGTPYDDDGIKTERFRGWLSKKHGIEVPKSNERAIVLSSN